MPFNEKKLFEATKKIFKDCLLPNGAVVAAPVHHNYYPKESISYMYVWPGRDLGFVLAAMILLGEDYYELVLNWIWHRAEDFQESSDKSHEGLLFRDYHLNGRIHLHYFQPDQNGTLLWSIWFYHEQTKKPLTGLEKKVVNKASQALIRIWDKDHFILPTEDLWEERGVKDPGGVLTYSLAACAKGLACAAELTNNKMYLQTSKQMNKVLQKHCWNEKLSIIPRRFGGSKENDYTIDSSLLGLIWPFNTGLNKEHLKKTLNAIENNLLSERGLYRYPEDYYEGSQGDWHNHKNKQAGAWPLLTFWLSIACSEMGEAAKAKKYFNLVFKNTGDDYALPEQLFCCQNASWTGVKPLLWSNAMAVFAWLKLNN